jgi:hypothetical protein
MARRLQKNIGASDRIMRFLIALVLSVVALRAQEMWMQIVLSLGVLFVLYEVISSWCLFYQLIGKNTCPVQKRQ